MKTVPLRDLPAPGAYARVWKRLIDADEGRVPGYDPTRFDEGILRKFWPSDTAREVRRSFTRALHVRITLRGAA